MAWARELPFAAASATVEPMNELRAAVMEAREELLAETGLDQEALFGERVLEPHDMTARAAYAAGVIDGAAIALGLTALMLLDELDAVRVRDSERRAGKTVSDDC
jgi:hypothetical protein